MSAEKIEGFSRLRAVSPFEGGLVLADAPQAPADCKQRVFLWLNVHLSLFLQDAGHISGGRRELALLLLTDEGEPTFDSSRDQGRLWLLAQAHRLFLKSWGRSARLLLCCRDIAR